MPKTFKLDLSLLLPDAPDASDACVDRLLTTLRQSQGVVSASIVEDGDDALLEVAYEPDQVSLADIRVQTVNAGLALHARYGHVIGVVDGLRHVRHAATVQAAIAERRGVLEARLDPSGAIRIEYDKNILLPKDVHQTLADQGLKLRRNGPEVDQPSISTVGEGLTRQHAPEHPHADDHAHDHDHGSSETEANHDHSHGGILGPNTELIFALTCGGLLGLGFALEKLVAGLPGWIPMALFVAAYGFGGFFTVREAVENLKRKRFEIDTLMLVAAAGAAALGAWAEGALLLFLFSIGHALEHYAMGRAKRAIEALAELAPRTARVRRDGTVLEVSVETLQVGEVVLVRPNERLPADGFVIEGATSINQAPVTGESMPVDKQPVSDPADARVRPASVGAASIVFAGTINGAGAIEIETTRRSSDTTLAKVVRMVSEAETQKSPTQRFTDRFEKIFVPVVLLLAFTLLFSWVVIDEPFRDSFYRAMAVLVAASPCALAIATPSAVLSGVARAARAGVLIKGGAPLENLGALDAIAFDKTGTLTEGRPRITDVLPTGETTEDELLRVATAVENLSDHPLAEAIARDGAKRLQGGALPKATELRSLTGKGVVADIEGLPVWIGKPEMFGVDDLASLDEQTQASVDRLRAMGRTLMVVRRGGRDLGVIGLLDTPRAAARETLQALRALGVRRMIMISGDHQKAAEAIAGQVGLDEAWGDLLPEGKVEAIKRLQTQTRVAMVGDGVNDAPAMATSSVGIAMGAAGSDVALETADVALMGDDLSQLPFTVDLSRRTRSIIRQNLVVSLGVVAILVPATIFGLGIGPAVALHEGSTLLVVINALRLLGHRDRRATPGRETASPSQGNQS